MTHLPVKIRIAFFLYELLWKIAMPFLFCNRRLRQGWQARMLWQCPTKTFDIWLHAASVGEAYLALELLQNRPFAASVLITATTSQGLDILKAKQNELDFACTYFPFDQKKLQKKFIEAVKPKLVVILETELWLSMLLVCKEKKIPVCVVNARMSERSFSRYKLLRPIFAAIFPDLVLAISEEIRLRFQTIFPKSETQIMGNIKFDRFLRQKQIAYEENPLAAFFDKNSLPAVFASVRQEEEDEIFAAICLLKKADPDRPIALVPRHAHRVSPWLKRLNNFSPVLRSNLQGIQNSGVIIWDIFGEMNALYALAGQVFVGGSLAPLGGQNFLEPLAQGIIPIIGESWSNFAWVGKEIFTQKLVLQVKTGEELAQAFLNSPKPNREETGKKAQQYAHKKGGGCKQVWQTIQKKLQD